MAVILSLREMSINSIANNFDLYEEDRKLLSLPSEVSSELLNRVLKNPRFKPTERTLPLKAKEVDLVDVDEVHQGDKIRYIFEKCRKEVESLTLPRDFFRALMIKNTNRVVTIREIQNPKDALLWFFCTAIPEFFFGKLPETYFYTVSLGDGLFENLKILKLQPGNKDRLIFTYDLCIDSINSLAKLCPNVNELYLTDWVDGFQFKNFSKNLRCLSIKNKPYLFGKGSGLGAFIETSRHIQSLFLKNCNATLPETGLSQLRSLSIVGGDIKNLLQMNTCYPKLKIFARMENITDGVFSLGSSTVKVLITDEHWPFRFHPEKWQELRDRYPAAKLVIVFVPLSLSIAMHTVPIPENLLAVTVTPSNVGREIEYLSKLLDEDKNRKYTRIAEQYARMILAQKEEDLAKVY